MRPTEIDWRWLLKASIVAVPSLLLLLRLLTGQVVAYGWGWQMFSY